MLLLQQAALSLLFRTLNIGGLVMAILARSRAALNLHHAVKAVR